MSDLYHLELHGMQQSVVDPDDPTRLVFDYVRRIGDVIDRLPPGPLRVLHVGGAAMTLPRYVHATRPRSSQIVLEPDEQVIAQVRSEIPLPPRSGIKVRPVDGASGIEAVRDGSQDVVVLDAFAAAEPGSALAAVTPPELLTTAFVDDVRRVLAPGGVLAANLVEGTPFRATRDFVAAVRTLGDAVDIAIGVEPSTLKGRRPGNLVVLAGRLPDLPFGRPSPMAYRVFADTAVSDAFGGGTPR